jgi:uncharacterized protein YndB with AHSA1/START domain
MIQFNAETDLELTRLLAAPPHIVWRCWTEPALLRQWWTPRPVVTKDAVMNPVAGGRFFTLMVLPDGSETPNEGSFLEVVKPERLVFTDLLTAGWCPVDEPGLGFTAIITFAAEGAGTRYRAVARHRSPAARQSHADMGFADGWAAAAQQLDDLAQGLM